MKDTKVYDRTLSTGGIYTTSVYVNNFLPCVQKYTVPVVFGRSQRCLVLPRLPQVDFLYLFLLPFKFTFNFPLSLPLALILPLWL